MTESLKSRKQEFARDAIFEAAMDLFVRKGYQETNVEDVAMAAGVSRRSFFRYFTTKDHVLGHNIVRHGDILVSAVAACPAESSAREVVRDTVLAGMRFSTSHPRTRQIIAITARNLSARRAHKSRIVDVEIRLAEAFAARTRSETKDDIRPRLLSILTLMLGDLALTAWFKGEVEDYSEASDYVFSLLSRVLCEPAELQMAPASSVRKLKSPSAKTAKAAATRARPDSHE